MEILQNYSQPLACTNYLYRNVNARYIPTSETVLTVRDITIYINNFSIFSFAKYFFVFTVLYMGNFKYNLLLCSIFYFNLNCKFLTISPNLKFYLVTYIF